jgi:predicted HTH domain antitoxin
MKRRLMQVTIELPDHVDEHAAREAFVAALYGTGQITEKEGCDILGVSRREFQDMLAREEVPYMTAGSESAAVEIEAIERRRP